MRHNFAVNAIVVVLLLVLVGSMLWLYDIYKNELPQVGTAIGVQNVFVDTSGVELATSGEVVISFPYTPCTSIVFGDNVGKISWEDGIMEFEGDAYLSATIFFEYLLKPMIDGYITKELMR